MIHIVDKISSTNNWLPVYFFEEGDTILSIKQSKGRGRRGNSWDSEMGGAYFSTISCNHNLLPFITGISIVETLNEFCDDLKLKWPNDIIYQGKKLGGVLCENLGDYSIAGVGLNINNNPPFSTAINLSSLDFELDKYNFVLSFLDHFQMMFSLSSKEIIEKYLVFDCLVGNEITWESGTGVVKSIGIDGSLIVEMSGETVTLYSEEVHIEKY